jgi:L-fucose mutarotase/ribose pyranase (RbsD/FucU family)
MLRASQIVAMCVLGLGLVVATPACAGRIHSVISRAGLIDALARAESGDRIVLAAGNYGAIDIRDRVFSIDVTLQSANSTQPAIIETMTISNSAHLAFRSLEIGRALKVGEADYSRMVSIRATNNVKFDSINFRGSLDNNPRNDGYGLVFNGGRGLEISNSSFTEFNRAVQVGTASDITVKNTRFFGLRSDGLNFADVQRVVIDRNSFRDFTVGDGDHPDAIQFWTTGTTRSSTDIVITNNEIFQGRGAGTQGIFLTDQVGSLPYQNVRIENNLLYVFDGYNGIMVANGRGVQIIGNSILSEQSDNQKFWIRLEKTEGSIVRNNIADSIVNQNNAGMTLANNVFLDKDPSFAKRIVGLSAQANATAASLIVPGIGYQTPR